jgi:hypothetical protein
MKKYISYLCKLFVFIFNIMNIKGKIHILNEKVAVFESSSFNLTTAHYPTHFYNFVNH